MKKNDSELYGERLISDSEIISFPNPSPERAYQISIELPEFTCQCPFSGYPDVAVIRWLYQPAEKVLESAKNSGAQGATINYARGTGIREKLGILGVTIDEQKEIIRVIVSEEQSEIVFEAMYLAGDLDKPGKGIMYMSELDKVATYIPDAVLENVK